MASVYRYCDVCARAHYTGQCRWEIPPIPVETILRYSLPNIVNTTLQLDGWWGDKSVLLHRRSALCQFKLQFIDNLLELGVIKTSDVDARNRTPHIQLINKSNRKSQEMLYRVVDQMMISFSGKDIRIKDKYVELDIGSGRHLTLVWKQTPFRGDHMTIVQGLLIQLVSDLFINAPPAPVVAPTAATDDRLLCKICMSAPITQVVKECGHACVCDACSRQVTETCPICRGPIARYERFYL